MEEKDKQLLLKDICARLPYGVMVEIIDKDETIPIRVRKLQTTDITYMNDKRFLNENNDGWWISVKPYLRPMSSMTDEEETLFRCELPAIAKTDAQLVAMRMELFLKGHLDFNHLIGKGLALEAPNDMYKTE